MIFTHQKLVIVFFFIATVICKPGGQHITTLTYFGINNVSVPQQLWSSVAIDSLDVIELHFLCMAGTDTVPGARFQIDLDNGLQHYSNSQYELSKNFINLPNGKYSLTLQAQSATQEWTAVPFPLLFSVDSEQSKKFKKEIMTFSSNEHSGWFRDPLFIILLIVVVAAIVVIYIMRRQVRVVRDLEQKVQESDAAALEQVLDNSAAKDQTSFDAMRAKMLEEEVEILRRESVVLTKKIMDLVKKADELTGQNQDLEGQVERVSTVKHELEALQRQKDDLFTIIIHDIKNPASLVKNLVDLLRGYDLNATETQEVMQDIIDTTTKIVSLSQELSRVMAMEYAEIVIEKQEASPAMLIESVCRRNSAAALKKNITVSFYTPPDIPACEFDPQKMEEVMDNLVNNAIKFSLPGTAIKVRAIPLATSIRIEVHDQGLGMSKDDMVKAFQRGVKLSARPTGDEPSSGLGLWIVKRLVEAHHGTVSVSSELGKGSILGVEIPYKQPVAS